MLPSGEVVWTQALADTAAESQVATAVTVNADGIVYAAGYVEFAGDLNDAWLHALDPNGDALWQARHDGDAGLSEELTDVAVSSTGVVAVGREEISRTGGMNTSDSEEIVVVLAYSSSGELAWKRELAAMHGNEVHSAAPQVAVRDDGNILVGAVAELDGGWGRLFFTELTVAGEHVREWEYDDEAYRGLELGDIDVDDLRIMYTVATAHRVGVEGEEEWLAWWDANGEQLGTHLHPHEEALAVGVNARSGGALALGRIEVDSQQHPLLRRYGPHEEELWIHRIDIPAQPQDLVTDCNGDALVLASTETQAFLFRFGDEGNELDRHRIADDANTSFYAITTDPFGNPIVAGRSDDTFAVRKLAR